MYDLQLEYTDVGGLKIEEFAQQITPNVNMSDLALPAHEKKLLYDIICHAREKLKVYEDQGIAKKSDRGLGQTILFLGNSRTAKIMAAKVLAGELKLDLYKVNLSAVVSKYIGETEKVLQRLFDECETVSGILFFDEADALFGKRTEVKDSHDRYSDVPIDYILKRIGAYQGLVILSTNNKKSKDSAFAKRIRFVVTFSNPPR